MSFVGFVFPGVGFVPVTSHPNQHGPSQAPMAKMTENGKNLGVNNGAWPPPRHRYLSSPPPFVGPAAPDDAPLPSRTGAWRQWFGRPASKGTPATPAGAYREGPPPPERAASPLSPARLGSFRKPPPPPEPTGSGWA